MGYTKNLFSALLRNHKKELISKITDFFCLSIKTNNSNKNLSDWKNMIPGEQNKVILSVLVVSGNIFFHSDY